MEIPVKILNKWKALRSHGDAAELQKQSEYSDETFNRAFREEKCSDEVFKVMAEFYDKKGEAIKQYL